MNLESQSERAHARKSRDALARALQRKTAVKGQSRPLLYDLLIGAVAGVAATWIMDRVTTVMYERESRAARQREDEVRGNKTAYEIAADKVARSAGVDLRRQHEKQIGTAIHWILGSGSGACYGALRHVVPMRLGSGLAYGVLFWFVMDEAALTLLGVTAPPQAFPWQTHARGLVGHIVLGTTIEALFGAADLVGTTAS